MKTARLFLVVAVVGLGVGWASPAAAAERISVLLDWAFLPYHAPFLLAQDRGFYREEGLEVIIEQGRGSASSAVVVGQGNFDLGHINVTNAAQAIGKGVPLKVVAVYQHRSSASFVGIDGNVDLQDPGSLKGIKIGSTPGGSDALSLALFTRLNEIPKEELNVISLDGAAKRAALLNKTVDVVSGDSHAYAAILRGQGVEPVVLQLSDYGVPLLGFGFVANESFLERAPQAIEKFLKATKRGFQLAVSDPKAACEFIQAKRFVTGSLEQCVDYSTGLYALSQAPTDPDWGRQSPEEWENLVDTLKDAGFIDSDRKPSEYFTNQFVP